MQTCIYFNMSPRNTKQTLATQRGHLRSRQGPAAQRKTLPLTAWYAQEESTGSFQPALQPNLLNFYRQWKFAYLNDIAEGTWCLDQQA